MAWPLGLDEVPLTASAIFEITEVMKEVCGKCAECALGTKGARNSRSRRSVCDRQVAVMKAVTREMEDALGGGYLNKGCADGW